MVVTPDNVGKLPSFDVTFLLTVYYHWGAAYGWEEAESMLHTVAENTDTLFLQTPQTDKYIDSPVFKKYSTQSPVEMHIEYLKDILDGMTVEHIGTTDYTGGDRKDSIYIIESSPSNR